MDTYTRQIKELWQEVKNERLFKLKYFLLDTYIFSKYDLHFIDKNKVQLEIAPLKIPDCKTCKKNCCRGVENTVSLRLSDIARLLDADLEEYIDMNNKVNFEPSVLKKFPGIKNNIKSDTWRKFPILKRVNNVCPLLNKKNECTIYEIRPLTCRWYPYSLQPDLKTIKFSKHCINAKTITEIDGYAKEHTDAAIEVYNEKIKDLILLHHARKELNTMGIGKYLL